MTFDRRTVWTALRAFHRDERGMPEESMSKIMIFMLVAIPLIGLLIWFGSDILTKSQETYNETMGAGGVPAP